MNGIGTNVTPQCYVVTWDTLESRNGQSVEMSQAQHSSTLIMFSVLARNQASGNALRMNGGKCRRARMIGFCMYLAANFPQKKKDFTEHLIRTWIKNYEQTPIRIKVHPLFYSK